MFNLNRAVEKKETTDEPRAAEPQPSSDAVSNRRDTKSAEKEKPQSKEFNHGWIRMDTDKDTNGWLTRWVQAHVKATRSIRVYPCPSVVKLPFLRLSLSPRFAQ